MRLLSAHCGGRVDDQRSTQDCADGTSHSGHVCSLPRFLQRWHVLVRLAGRRRTASTEPTILHIRSRRRCWLHWCLARSFHCPFLHVSTLCIVFPAGPNLTRSSNPTALNWGPQYGYIWFPSCLLAAAFCFLFIPETKDRTLEEINEMFLARVPARKFRKYQCQIHVMAHEKSIMPPASTLEGAFIGKPVADASVEMVEDAAHHKV